MNSIGGADTRYTFVNGTDYRKENNSVYYQLQAIHSTKVHHYNDTLDMLIYNKDTDYPVVVKVGEYIFQHKSLNTVTQAVSHVCPPNNYNLETLNP